MNFKEWILTQEEINKLWQLKPSWINLVDDYIVAVWEFGSSFEFQNNIEVKIDTDFSDDWLGWHIKKTTFRDTESTDNSEKYTKTIETFDYGSYEEMVKKLKELLEEK